MAITTVRDLIQALWDCDQEAELKILDPYLKEYNIKQVKDYDEPITHVGDPEPENLVFMLLGIKK